MATPKVQLDNMKLLKRMEILQQVTGKQVSATLKRVGRLLAVNLAHNTPPYGKNTSSKLLGERALMRDLMRLFYVMTPERIRGIMDFQGRSATMKYGHKGAEPLGNITEKILLKSEMHKWHQDRRTKNGRVSKARHGVTTGHRIKDLKNLDKGIVTEKQLRAYYRERMQFVGLSKAAWASCITKINADVKNPFAGIPAWVKRHISKVASDVVDNTEGTLPIIKITSKIPWAHQVMSEGDYREALRITREKFYNSMGREIKAALKAEKLAAPTP
jgi:hypothetical protein